MTTYTERTSTESPVATRRLRTPIGILEIARHHPLSGALTLTIAAGRARGTHSDDSAGQSKDEARREQRDTCADLMREYGLARITVYAPRAHGGYTVEVREAK